MKKIIPLLLTLAILAAMSANVFASSITDTETGNSQEVLASYEEGVQDKTIISVDISWNQMNFTYKGASEPVWDALEHQYVGEATEAHWAVSDATITVTNHSNTVLQAIISYAAEEAFSGISMLYTDAAPYIGSAYTSDEEAGQPCSVTIQAIPDGALSADTQDNTKIGTVTVKVEAGVDPLVAVENIGIQASIYASQSADNLARGGVYFNPEADVSGILSMIDATTDILCDDGQTKVAQNTAFNAMLTAYYGALEITQ